MSMTIPEAHAEIRRLYDAAAEIEKKYPGGLTQADNAEDYTEVKRLLGEIDGLEDKLSGLEEADERKKRILDNQKRLARPSHPHQQPENDFEAKAGGGGSYDAFARQFLDSTEYKNILESGVLNNPSSRVDFSVKLQGSLLDAILRKALISGATGSGGALIRNERVAGVESLFRDTTLLDLIPTAATTSNTIEYFSQITKPSSAAFVAEASATTGTTGTKPEGTFTWQLNTSPVGTLAEWVPVTNQQLADAPAMEGIIRTQLLLDLEIQLETQIIQGNGTPPNLTGIVNTANIQTIGLGAGSGNVADAVYQAMTQVMVTGLANPTASVWNPINFQAVRLMRENVATATLGGYLLGPPSVAGTTTLWGRPAVLAIGMPAATVLVADFQRATMLFDREQAAIRVGLANDDFIRNMQRILAELRAAFVVFRPTAICRVTGAP